MLEQQIYEAIKRLEEATEKYENVCVVIEEGIREATGSDDVHLNDSKVSDNQVLQYARGLATASRRTLEDMLATFEVTSVEELADKLNLIPQ
jgi:hypothetical protein